MEILANYGTVLIIVAAVFGFLMAIGIGANDVANAMGTSVGSKALTVKQAIIIAMIFEFAGAYLAGGEVTETIRNGVIETSLFADKPDVLIYGMMSALLAAGTWLLVASYMGWPVFYHRRYYWFRVRFCRYRSGRLELSKRHCRQLDYYSGDFRLLCVPHFCQRTTPHFRYRKTADQCQAFRTGIHVHHHYGDCSGYHQKRS